MNEQTPTNPENQPENQAALSPDQIEVLKKQIAAAELQNAADAVLVEKENTPQIERGFQVHPDTQHAQMVDKIVGQPKVEALSHEEIPGHSLPNDIKSPEERMLRLSEIIATPKAKTLEPGGADDLQHQMEQLYSAGEKSA